MRHPPPQPPRLIPGRPPPPLDARDLVADGFAPAGFPPCTPQPPRLATPSANPRAGQPAPGREGGGGRLKGTYQAAGTRDAGAAEGSSIFYQTSNALSFQSKIGKFRLVPVP